MSDFTMKTPIRRCGFIKTTLLASASVVLLCCTSACAAADGNEQAMVLASLKGVEALFTMAQDDILWTGLRDTRTARQWRITGPRFSVQTHEGARTDLTATHSRRWHKEVNDGHPAIVIETSLSEPRIDVQQVFSFCGDDRTLRIRTRLRAPEQPVLVSRLGILELQVKGQSFRLTGPTGPDLVSFPIFGADVFGGVEHPSALCQATNDSFAIAQPIVLKLDRNWVDIPPAVFGCIDANVEPTPSEALRRSFLRYLDTVRIKPKDLHVNYNDWWTAPFPPSSEQAILEIIASLKKGLYDPTGFFFDSYTMDAGWSDPKRFWAIDRQRFPGGFSRICSALEQINSHAGLWISPSSGYSFSLDNDWLEANGYELTPTPEMAGLAKGKTACIAKGGKYQRAFKEAVLAQARDAHLAQMKFDVAILHCDVAAHGHPVGPESCLPLAEGLMEVFDALRAQNPDIALDSMCVRNNPSPWWLMHVPYVLGPQGDDCPSGRSPAPEWIEALTTARDIEVRNGRDVCLMPSSALDCLDIVVQSPGPFQNHAVMALARGRWFLPCYINPKFMEPLEWKFFADLVAWARSERERLQDPLPFGGDPAQRQAYGYAFYSGTKEIHFLRNPWIGETTLAVPASSLGVSSSSARVLRMIYPRRAVLASVKPGISLPPVTLGPYETAIVEVVNIPPVHRAQAKKPVPKVRWKPGPTSAQKTSASLEGQLTTKNADTVQICVLVEGAPGVSAAKCALSVDGKRVQSSVSGSESAFNAVSVPPKESWVWFMSPLDGGSHRLAISADNLPSGSKVGVYACGTSSAGSVLPPFEDGTAAPLFNPERVGWSRTLWTSRE